MDNSDLQKRLLDKSGSINGPNVVKVPSMSDVGEDHLEPQHLKPHNRIIEVANKSLHAEKDKVPPAKSSLRYFHVEVRGNIVIQGIVSPFRQIVSRHTVDTHDPSINMYKDAVADVVNKHAEQVSDGEHHQFEKKGLCKVTLLKIGVVCEANRLENASLSDAEERFGEETEIRPKSLQVLICCAVRHDFCLTERFVNELESTILVIIPFADLNIMQLGLLGQDANTQAQLHSAFHKLVQKYGLDKLQETRRQVAEVKQAMHKNIKAALERGENLQEVCDKTEEMTEESMRFRTTAIEVRRQTCFSRWRARGIALICCVILLAVIVVPLVVYFCHIKVKKP
mmetsp:Transcript_7415/g.10400  ORF Transcript_7415/g.10400 Transcript_7415/m.10400 type:complete len:340 (-) Transcript_7415:165-1184(-)